MNVKLNGERIIAIRDTRVPTCPCIVGLGYTIDHAYADAMTHLLDLHGGQKGMLLYDAGKRQGTLRPHPVTTTFYLAWRACPGLASMRHDVESDGRVSIDHSDVNGIDAFASTALDDAYWLEQVDEHHASTRPDSEGSYHRGVDDAQYHADMDDVALAVLDGKIKEADASERLYRIDHRYQCECHESGSPALHTVIERLESMQEVLQP